MQPNSKNGPYQTREYHSRNDSSDAQLEDGQNGQERPANSTSKQHYSGGLFLFSNDEYSYFSKDSPYEGRDDRSHKYVKQYIVKNDKGEGMKDTEEKTSPKHASMRENRIEADLIEDGAYYQKTNLSNEMIDGGDPLMMSRGNSIKGTKQQGQQYGELLNLLEDGNDDKIQIGYRNPRGKEQSGSESPSGRRGQKGRKDEHDHRKGNQQQGSHKQGHNQDSKNTKNKNYNSGNSGNENRSNPRQVNQMKPNQQSLAQTQNEDLNVEEEIIAVNDSSNNNLLSSPPFLNPNLAQNPEVQNIIWNQNQFNITMQMPPQLKNPQQMYMYYGQNSNTFMPEQVFPRADGMYGFGFQPYPNYMLPMNQYPVMQPVPQFQGPQFQPMPGNWTGMPQINTGGEQMKIMQMNTYTNVVGSSPNDFDEELEPLQDNSQKQRQGNNNRGQKKQNNNRNTNNRGNDNNQGVGNNNNIGNNNRNKSNNNNNQNKGNPGKNRNNQNENGNWTKENQKSMGLEDNMQINSNSTADALENRSRQQKQNKKEEPLQASQFGELQEDETEELIEQACVLSKDQSGCRKLQKKLETGDQAVITRIFEKILPNFGELMIDPFGNYLCQKVIETCSIEQVGIMINNVTPYLISICLNPHGTRAVQKLIEVCADKDRMIEQVVNALAGDVVVLVKDNNGNHVIQKCLISLSSQHRQFIYDSIIESCLEVGTHKHGCCVIQRCLDSASPEQKQALVQVIVDNTLDLVRDQYGNYVVQYVLDLRDIDEQTKQDIGENLVGSAIDLSKEKFSSNVIEKCLILKVPYFQENLVQQLLQGDALEELLCDNFANYVVQRCLSLSDDNQIRLIMKKIQECIDNVRNDPIGQKILQKLAKTYPILDSFESNANYSGGQMNYDNRRNDDNRGNYNGGGSNNYQKKNNKSGNNNSNNDKRNQKNLNQNNNNNNSRQKKNSNNQRGNNDGGNMNSNNDFNNNRNQNRGNKQGMNQKQNNNYGNNNNSSRNSEIGMMSQGMGEMPNDNIGNFYPNVNMNTQFRGGPSMGFVQPVGFMPPQQGMYMTQTPMFNNRPYNQGYPSYPSQGFPYQQMG